MGRFTPRPALAGAALVLAVGFTASAQPAGQPQQGQPSSAMSGLTANRDQPMRIESNSLEVRDKIRQATFAGDVKLTQGDTVIKCKVLVVFYEDPPPPGAKKAAPSAGPQAQKAGGQQIKRAEARGDVLVTQNEQTASGDNGVYDPKANTVVMTGNVVVTQGQSVTRGERLMVNLTTGVTTVEANRSGPTPGRVEFLTVPGAKDAKGAPTTPPTPAAPPPASVKAAPKPPTATK